jgi:glycosyltransferase involved in cell wall biosynthesis
MISILLPIYNGIEFLEESLQSILQQTFVEWELLIGINGHPPNSEVYLKAKSFESISKKIRVFDFDLNKVKGKSETLNELINYCSFDYIALIDVDDIWHPLKLEKQVSIIRLNKYDVIGTNCVYFGDRNGSPNIPLEDFNDSFDFHLSNPIINPSAIIKKELCFWRNDLFGIEDYDLWLRLKKQGKRFYNCRGILVKHRIHNSSSFNSKGNSDRENLKKILG